MVAGIPEHARLRTTAFTSASDVQHTQRQHSTEECRKRRFRVVVSQGASRFVVVVDAVVEATSQVGHACAVGSRDETFIETTRIGRLHVAPSKTIVLDEDRTVSKLGTAGLHARVSERNIQSLLSCRTVGLSGSTHPLDLRHELLEAPMASTVVPTLQLNVVESVAGVTDDISTKNNESSVGIVSEVGGNVGDPQDEEDKG